MNKRILKAFVKYDGSKKVISGSNIFRKSKPKNGDWSEIPGYLCCNNITTTTTTTAAPSPFISLWRTTISNEPITLPYSNTGSYSGIIDWGDGSTSVNSYDNRTHIYTTAGDYTITITGGITGWSFGLDSDATNAGKIITISQWGNDFRLGNAGSYFLGCANLDLSGVTDILNLTGTTNLSYMFSVCTLLTTVNKINEWDVSNVVDMNNMFSLAPAFNGNITSWNTSNVTNMDSMFGNYGKDAGPTAFNQDISGWNVSNVTNMFQMFWFSTSFNQNIGNWNVSGVTNMDSMFTNASTFNQDLSSWCVTLIPSAPIDFATGATAWVLPQPIWGTCP